MNCQRLLCLLMPPPISILHQWSSSLWLQKVHVVGYHPLAMNMSQLRQLCLCKGTHQLEPKPFIWLDHFLGQPLSRIAVVRLSSSIIVEASNFWAQVLNLRIGLPYSPAFGFHGLPGAPHVGEVVHALQTIECEWELSNARHITYSICWSLAVLSRCTLRRRLVVFLNQRS